MTCFSLPITQADNEAAFSDAASATRWLAGQPQANAPAMLANLVTQIEAFNRYETAPELRWATLEALRKTVFAVSAESRRRYEFKSLPLLPAEFSAFDGGRRLWRACAVAYLHCLGACLAQRGSSAAQSAEVTNRALSCLRLEQTSCYVAGAEPSGDSWQLLHAAWAAAERLGIERHAVVDRLLRETIESTATGQYGMALLLHLARPHTLSRGQFAALGRWLARWRELADVRKSPEANLKPASGAMSTSRHGVAIDLASARPVDDSLGPAASGRWLALGAVLRKMRERVDRLASGQSPESLKLGSGLSAAECMALLSALADRLVAPLPSADASTIDQGESVVLATGLENCYRLLGGAPLKAVLAASSSSFASQLSVEQIAVFGHVVRETDLGGVRAAEIWRIAPADDGDLHLTRAPGSGDARLALRDVLALRLPGSDEFVLATVSGLYARDDGYLCATACRLPGKPTPWLAEVREKAGGKVSLHAVVLLASEGVRPLRLAFIPAGLSQRALSIRFFDAQGRALAGLRLGQCLARGGDSERWTIVGAA